MIEPDTQVIGDFGQAVLDGLSQTPKVVPARFFYDLHGSELFEEITRAPEYYPTRVETGLLAEHAGDIGRLAGHGRPIVEFGAGSLTKTPLLIEATHATTYVPVDIAGEFLEQSVAQLAMAHPSLRIVPIVGDFTQAVALPRFAEPPIGFFPGSTIGNCDHASAIDLLRSFRMTLGDGAHLVIGMDTRKNSRLLEAAYDDAGGVTAAFNLNLLDRINRELDGTIPVKSFEHRAVWHDGLGRIEMHLVASEDVRFTVLGRHFTMRGGETIHTENSHKYTLPEARLMARASGWEPLAFWTDPAEMFGLHVWVAAQRRMQP